MRGKADRQAVRFVAAIGLEPRVRPGHPPRAIKRMAGQGLAKPSRRLAAAAAAAAAVAATAQEALALITPADAAGFFRHCGYPAT